jgi:Flp pilus assembly protein TadB
MMQTVVALMASGFIALIGYSYFRQMEFSLGGGRSASARMERFASADRRGMADRLGDSLVDRFGLTIEGWEHELMWAQLGGFYEGKTVGSVLGLVTLYALAVTSYILLTQSYSISSLGMLALAIYYPYMQLKGKANQVRKGVKRSLPEAAALISAEMSAGSSAETAFVRSAGIPGPLGKMIKDTVSIAQKTGRLIFSRDLIEGVVVEYFSKYKTPEIEAFARQIDMVAEKGTDGPRQMNEVARGLARAYRSDVKKLAEQLSNDLLMPMTLYIFIPFMLSIFVPLFVSIFQSF